MPSCSQMRLQLLHFHSVFKTWPTFQELTSIVSFRRRRWSQGNFGKNRNIQGKQSKDILSKTRITKKYFSCFQRWRRRPRLLRFQYCFSCFGLETVRHLTPSLWNADPMARGLIYRTFHKMIYSRVKLTLHVEQDGYP